MGLMIGGTGPTLKRKLPPMVIMIVPEGPVG